MSDMLQIAEFLRRLRMLVLRRKHFDSDLDEEMRLHRELRERELLASGAVSDATEARCAAQRALGNELRLRKESRDAWGWRWLEHAAQDARYALRGLRKNPCFAAVAILTLAFGIGANTTIFSVVNAVLLRPLTFPQSRQLVLGFGRTAQVNRTPLSYADFEDWRAQTRSFASLAAWRTQSINLTGREEPQRIRGGFVSSSFFTILGVVPSQGRAFLPGEDQRGSDRVAVISHGAWQNRFGGDPAILGSHATFNAAVFTIVGVLPEGFEFPIDVDRPDVWLPISAMPDFTHDRKTLNIFAIARMNPGVTLAAAQAEMTTVAVRLGKDYPDADGQRTALLQPLQQVAAEDLRPILLVLFAAVGFVLLIACANVVNLLLARSAARGKEIALRAALGAGRSRLILQLLTETFVLWFAGAALGLVLGYAGLRALLTTTPEPIPPCVSVTLDAAVFAFACLLAALSGVVSGLGPALHFSRPDVNASLKEGGRTAGKSAGRSRLRGLLLVSQVALSLVLLAGSGLMVRTIARLSGVNPGFDPKNVLTLEYRLPMTKYPERVQQWNFHSQVVERVRALPGVRAATVMLGIPFSGNFGLDPVLLLDRPAPLPGQEPVVQTQVTDTHFFETMRTPLIEGRTFSDSDQDGSLRVALINRSMAEKFWPHCDPIGKQLELLDEQKPTTIVGVVGDVKQIEVSDPATPQVYFPYAQSPGIFASLAVRTEGDPMAMANAVRQAVWSVDRDQPMWKVRSLESLMAGSIGDRRYLAFLLSLYAAVALALAAIGIYGVLSYSVGGRIHEIGIRMSLGAQPSHVLRLVIGEGMAQVFAGLTLGLIGSLWLMRLLQNFLYGVAPTDPTTLTLASAILAAAGLAACYLPARRAMRVDPMVALRHE